MSLSFRHRCLRGLNHEGNGMASECAAALDWPTAVGRLGVALGCKAGSEFIPQNRLSIIPPTNPLPYNPV